ncbi:MAG: hypothetical protein DWH94_07755 [Planctomycetota bacterium]|nr:MAG: hypothetical protein DWH94_07755 [Planctomycetota bacterium]
MVCMINTLFSRRDQLNERLVQMFSRCEISADRVPLSLNENLYFANAVPIKSQLRSVFDPLVNKNLFYEQFFLIFYFSYNVKCILKSPIHSSHCSTDKQGLPFLSAVS